MGERERGVEGCTRTDAVPRPALVEVREDGRQWPVAIARTFPSTGLRGGSAGG